MSSFVDQQFCVIGQHMRTDPDLLPANHCGGLSKRREHDDLGLEEREVEGVMKRPVNLDLGCRSKLETSRRRSTVRQLSSTSDFDLTPSTELPVWNDPRDPDPEESRAWTEDRMTKQWTDKDEYPQLRIDGFPSMNPSLQIDLNNYKSQNKRGANGEDIGRGERRERRDNDGGSDSDSGKGTESVSDCRQSPTEEIASPAEAMCKPTLCHQDLETVSDNGSVTMETFSMEQRKPGRNLDDEGDYSIQVPYLEDFQRKSDQKLMQHCDYYPVDPTSSLGMVNQPERLSKVERCLSPGSPGKKKSQLNGFTGDERFPFDVNIYGVIDSNNNNDFEFSSQSRVDETRCHEAFTPLRHDCKVDTSLEFKGTPDRTRHSEGADYGAFEADRDVLSSRRELQAKCQDMYGSRPSILGSQDVHSRLGSHPSVHDSRLDLHGSYGDVNQRHKPQYIHRDNHCEIGNSHSDVSDVYRKAEGCYDASSSGQGLPHRQGFQAAIQNHAHAAMRGSLDVFQNHDWFIRDNQNGIHDSRQSCYDYNRFPCSSIDSPSTEYSFGLIPGSVNSTPGRRYQRHESPAPSGLGAPRGSPQKGHRYKRRSTDIFFVTLSESDPEIYHEEFGKTSPGSHGDITPVQYRRMRSVPHDGLPPPGPRVLGSTHPALQQPFSDEEPVTLPRPAKPGRSAAAAEQQVSSGGKMEVKGQRQRPNRRWTNLGLTSGSGQETDELKQKTKATQGNLRFRVPSLFRSRKESMSKASRDTTTGITPGTTGSPVVSGMPVIDGARKRSDRETGIKSRRRSGNAVESGFETGSSQGSVGDISLWSMSLGSTQSVFDSAGRETPLPVQGYKNSEGSDHFRRSVSVPNPEGKHRSSVSFLDRLRTRLTPWKKSSSSMDRQTSQSDRSKSSSTKDGLTQTENHREEIQLAVLPLFVSQSRESTCGGQMEADESDRCAASSPTTTVSMTTSFESYTPTKLEGSAVRKVNFGDRQTSSSSPPATPSSSSSSSAAASAAETTTASSFVPETSAMRECFQSKKRHSRTTLKKAPPSDECFSAVSEMIEALARLSDFVSSSITSVPSIERTITEVEFKEYRSRMIDAVKEFNQACKQLVIRTPESEMAFLEALYHSRQSLDDVAEKYNDLIDCTSLPADRSKVATPVIAVAISLRETVTVACSVTGCPARHPVMLTLRLSANRLVVDLGLLMKSVREMNYSRLSRRF